MGSKIDLNTYSDDALLNLRIKDLPIHIEETWLDDCVDTLYKELKAKGIQFRPVCYLADEWLTPDGEPVVGIPFFLAHPALVKLERKMMLDVEGGTKQWCMKLLRHEAGHAINYAYQLHRKRKWQRVFGKFSQEYPDTYRFRPYSKNFVRHLEDYYAQYHPDEDFAETFAVWLTPQCDWHAQYKGWKALRKLLYVDGLMDEIKGKAPFVNEGKKYWEASRLAMTLKTYYRRKKRFYAEDFPDFHDANLKKIFGGQPDSSSAPAAHEIIKKYRKHIRDTVSLWAGEKKYIIDELLGTVGERCRELGLISKNDEAATVLEISTYITVLVLNYHYTGRFRGRRGKL